MKLLFVVTLFLLPLSSLMSSNYEEMEDLLVLEPMSGYIFDPEKNEATFTQILPGEVLLVHREPMYTLDDSGTLYVRVELEHRADHLVSVENLKNLTAPYELRGEHVDEIGALLGEIEAGGGVVEVECPETKGTEKQAPNTMDLFAESTTDYQSNDGIWLDKYMRDISFKTGGFDGGRFKPLTISGSCETYNQEICELFPQAFGNRPMTKELFLVIKAIIHQESGHDTNAVRWEDAGFRKGYWQKKLFKKFKKEFPGENLDMIHHVKRTELLTALVVNSKEKTKVERFVTVTREDGSQVGSKTRYYKKVRARWASDSGKLGSERVIRKGKVAGHPDAKKFESSFGPMQVLFATAKYQHGFKGQPHELFKPCVGLKYGLKHLAYNYDRAQKIIKDGRAGGYRDRALAAAGYNAGQITIKRDENDEKFLVSHKSEGKFYYQHIKEKSDSFASKCSGKIDFSNVCDKYKSKAKKCN